MPQTLAAVPFKSNDNINSTVNMLDVQVNVSVDSVNSGYSSSSELLFSVNNITNSSPVMNANFDKSRSSSELSFNIDNYTNSSPLNNGLQITQRDA